MLQRTALDYREEKQYRLSVRIMCRSVTPSLEVLQLRSGTLTYGSSAAVRVPQMLVRSPGSLLASGGIYGFL
jgi:hypothetical protein